VKAGGIFDEDEVRSRGEAGVFREGEFSTAGVGQAPAGEIDRT